MAPSTRILTDESVGVGSLFIRFLALLHHLERILDACRPRGDFCRVHATTDRNTSVGR